MAQNPLQQYFRQPKVYIKLPSEGAYNAPGTLSGDLTNVAIYGMTGMDEIIAKTPDALLSGETVAQVLSSCCPSIKDPWALTMLDLNPVLAAVRIATYGNTITVQHTCPKCSTENEYDVDISRLIDHYNTCRFDPDLILKDITVKLRPLTYKQSTEFSLRNFAIQQRIAQIDEMPEATPERTQATNDLFKDLADIQREMYIAGVDSVQTPQTTVTEQQWISEWLDNTDKSVFDAIKEHNLKNREAFTNPTYPVVCLNCSTENTISIDIDQSNFFV